MKKASVMHVVLKISKQVMGQAPIFFMVIMGLNIMQGAVFAGIAIVQQKFFDRAVEYAGGNASFEAAMIGLLALGGIYILSQAMTGISDFVPQILFMKVGGRLARQIHKKIGTLKPIDFEKTEMLDFIEKAVEGKDRSLEFCFTIMGMLTFYVPYFLMMSIYLYTLRPMLIWGMLLVFFPTLLANFIRIRSFANLEEECAPLRREMEYYEDCIGGRDYFKETRLLGAFSFFRKLYQTSIQKMHNLVLKVNVRANRIDLGMNVIILCGYMGILYMLFTSLMEREISVGAFTAIFVSLGSLYGLMDELLGSQMRHLANTLGMVRNYVGFLEIPEEEGTEVEVDYEQDIVLDHISFQYPQATEMTIKDVSLTLHPKETIAIVGENGSGKSTLIRLITGIYKPEQGTVMYGSYSTKDISMGSLSKKISAVFQKYSRYQMTLEENISISDMEKECKKEALEKASQLAGFSETEPCFPEGYETLLSKEFDGVDISGGQWQRVAIARAYYREHELIVLDEPTAAIDPFEETRIYNRFAELSKDKTAIIVTHRLGSVKLADRIVVMKEGRIVEVGNHQQLMEQKGEYERMYLSQAQWYEEKV